MEPAVREGYGSGDVVGFFSPNLMVACGESFVVRAGRDASGTKPALAGTTDLAGKISSGFGF